MRTTILLAAALTLGAARAQDPGGSNAYDVEAIMLLDQMAGNIGELHAVSFHLRTSRDVMDPDLAVPVRQLGEHQVHLVGPDKMLVDSRSDKGHRGYWADSTGVVLYNYTENNYGYLPPQHGLIPTIDSLEAAYGIELPASEFFNPLFVDKLIKRSTRIAYTGTSVVDGRPCFHVVAIGKERQLELWISNDALFQPVHYVIRTQGKNGPSTIEGVFSDWRINPDLPDAMFSFMPPPDANEVRILSRHEKPNRQ